MRHRVTVSRGLLLTITFENLRGICKLTVGTTFRLPVPREYRVDDTGFLSPQPIFQRTWPATIYNTFKGRAFVRVELDHGVYIHYRL